MTLTELNSLNRPQLIEALQTCCGSGKWVEGMASVFPVADMQTLLDEARKIWFSCEEADWLEAFSHHPKIGDLNSLKEKFASTSKWAEGEQAAVKQTSLEVLDALAKGNHLYEEKFGFIFIVCATGKSAGEMLELLTARLQNSRDAELKVAMLEQFKITQLRLKKLLTT